jgi:hypothetical protein
MAQVNALRQAYVRLGFTVAAATSIIADQGIDSLEELQVLRDSDISNLCKVVRRPGGTIANPQAGAPGQNPEIPNPGIPASLRAETNLKLGSFWLRHQAKVSRSVTAVDITLAAVRRLRELKDSEDQAAVKVDPPLINERDWTKTMEAIEEHLRANLGETKIPLAYVVREDIEMPAGADPSAGYILIQDEMIRRAPHRIPAHGVPVEDQALDPTFQIDNRKVWQILSDLCHDKDCWTYIKPFQRRRDGRGAYWGLWNHYLGPNNVDNMASTAESKLEKSRYYGEKRRHTFEDYVRDQKDQYQILHNLAEKGLHAGIDERSQVRHLVNGIRSHKLDVVKGQILANPTLRSDFDSCVTLYQDFITQAAQSGNPTFNVSGANTGKDPWKGKGKNKRTRAGDDGDSSDVEDRYYNPKEYAKLSGKKKTKLASMREARGGGKKKPQRNDLRAMGRQIAALEAKLEKQSSDEAKIPEEEVSNRTNSALTRQKKK